MSKVDEFYPISKTMKQCETGLWQLSMVIKLQDHLKAAKSGNRESESKLINRLGQIRRNVSSLGVLSNNLADVFKESVAWLRTVGRHVDFTHTDPGSWITARDGRTPRF